MIEIEKDSHESLKNNPTDYTKISCINRINCGKITYPEFFSNFMLKNVPVILTSISQNWQCEKWIKLDENAEKRMNFSQLRKEIPNIRVPVANCSKPYFNSHEKSEMNFHDFLDCWEKGFKDDPLYLKDWHLRKELPNYQFYNVPEFFASDWLNETLCDEDQDDYKFVYMGPKGTTSFHCDVFSSFSWSTNIVGRKMWFFLPPGEELKLKDRYGNLPFSISQKVLEGKNVKFFIVTQRPGEAVFVPSGWFHQVHNLNDTISINHNWFNGTQFKSIWKALESNLIQVQREIDDCRDMDNFQEHCQLLLRTSFGMNIEDFLTIMQKIAQKTEVRTRFFEGFQFGENHLLFDVKSIDYVLIDMLKSPTIEEKYIKKINEIRKKIETILEMR
uniref:Jumonji domain-containing protein 4 n=2 Tax=Lutzomyia longipalpis TaxID=7200 RepID=A0A1B0CIC4_LUTLO